MAETVKKAKAPAKPRAATATKEAATPKATTPKATTAKATTAKATTRKAAETAPPRVPTHDEIAQLARQYWAERGHADGHAEQDWLRAEKELTNRAS